MRRDLRYHFPAMLSMRTSKSMAEPLPLWRREEATKEGRMLGSFIPNR